MIPELQIEKENKEFMHCIRNNKKETIIVCFYCYTSLLLGDAC
jgi:hypothetical protein